MSLFDTANLYSKEIEKLSAFQKSRIRTEMYFGPRDPHTQIVLEYENGQPKAVETTWVPAIATAFREILDNSLDELIKHGHGDAIYIEFDPVTLTIMVQDNGRGIPIYYDNEHNQYAATMAMSEEHTGRNFGDERGPTRGMNGVGGAVSNFCSEWFQMDIWRDGKHFSQKFNEGDGSRNAQLQFDDPLIFPLKSKDKALRGTRIKFKLSEKVFKNRILPESFVLARVHEINLCYPDLEVYYNGKKLPSIKGGVEKSLFPNAKPISIEIEKPGFSSRFWLMPNFFEVNDQTLVTEINHSLVNCIPMFQGGTHIDVFRREFFSGMLTALEKESKKRKLNPNRGDLSDGLLLFNITEMDEPSFTGQAKMRLEKESVGIFIKQALNDPDFFKGIIRKYPEWVEQIYARCAARTQAKDNIEILRAAKRNLRVKIAKLEDACATDRSKCILFLTEGDSAVGGIADARDAEIHGAFPLRGKVKNISGISDKEILANEVLSNVMAAIGLIPGQRANRHALRYGKVYITADADDDGKNIEGLLVYFFHKKWPELFDPEKAPFIYLFDTPYIKAVKGKNRKYWYSDDYEAFKPSDYKGWEITRAKGLAGLDSEDWEIILKSPKARPALDDGRLKDTLHLIFDQEAKDCSDKRKKWMGI
jgi:DNA gyrase/topoisomerase IV subunit B